LDPQLVQETMEAITAQGLFVQYGIQLYNQVRSARYVTRSVDDVFEIAGA